jgi:hypothetical protein
VIAKVCDQLPPQVALLALRRVREDVLERLQAQRDEDPRRILLSQAAVG